MRQAQDEYVSMRDGYSLPVRFYGNKTPNLPLLVLVHDSSWHGMQFDTLARALSNHAYVAVADLRGHGEAPARRGDIDHIGQFEEDLADLISFSSKISRTENLQIIAYVSVKISGGVQG